MSKRYKRIYIEVTNVCNLKCSFCPIDQRDADFMDMASFTTIIRETAPLTEQVCLHLMGEPLAHPEFEIILKICHEFKSPVQITTNGVLLSKKADQILADNSVRQVNVSLQSYLDNYPNKDPEDYLNGILNFIDRCFIERPELYLNLRLWNLEGGTQSQTQNEQIFRFIEEYYQIKINRKVDVGHIKSKKLLNRLYLHFDSRFEWPRLEQENRSEQGRCNGLIDHFAIHADGTVVPCCLDDQKIINLGNVLETRIDSILNSSKATQIANGFRQNQLVHELCQKCDYIRRF